MPVPNWRKVVYLLNRGGRFDTQEASYKGDHVANKYGQADQPLSGKDRQVQGRLYRQTAFYGMARYVPIVDTLDREPVEQSKGYDLQMITQKDVRMTKSGPSPTST